jgi:hypothetical protein
MSLTTGPGLLEVRSMASSWSCRPQHPYLCGPLKLHLELRQLQRGFRQSLTKLLILFAQLCIQLVV